MSKNIAPIIYIILSVFILSSVGIAQGLLLEQLETQAISSELDGNVRETDLEKRKRETNALYNEIEGGKQAPGNQVKTENKPKEQQADTPGQHHKQTSVEVTGGPEKEEVKHIEKILSDHPDFIKITHSLMFDDYVDNLPLQRLKEARLIIESGTTEEAVKLISAFKRQEIYQKKHKKMIMSIVKNWTGMDRHRYAENIIQDWARQADANSVVTDLKVKKTFLKLGMIGRNLHLVYYNINKGQSQQEYLYLVNAFGNTVQAISLDPETRKRYGFH